MQHNHNTFFALLSMILTVVSAATVKNCFPNITEPNVPLLRLGGPTDLPRACEQAITPRLHQCHTRYVQTVRDAYVDAKCYEGAESVRRVMCCSLWIAKQCMIDASEALPDCFSPNITAAYRALPSAKDEREHVLDQCSEYGEGVAACEVDLRANFSFGVFVTILLVFISLPAIAFGAMKAHEFYQEYQKFKLEEEARKQQKASDGYTDDAMPLNEKAALSDDHSDDVANDELNEDELKA